MTNIIGGIVAIQMQRRMLYTPVFHIDTNLINSRGKLQSMNLLERWAENEIILINMSGVSFKEAQADGDLLRTKKALSQIFTMTDETINSTDPLYREIEQAVFPGAPKDDNQRNDLKIVFDAAKYAAILITRDGGSKTQPGGMLGNREKLRDYVTIMSDSEAVALVEAKIAERDKFNRRVAAEYGGELPPWAGKD